MNKTVLVLFFHDGEPLLVDIFATDKINQSVFDCARVWFDDDDAILSIDAIDPTKILIFRDGTKLNCCFYVETKVVKDAPN